MAYLVKSLVRLRNEVDNRWPNRDKASDGWIGDDSHATRKSGHNPKPNGAVRALDVDHDGPDWAKTDIQQAMVKATVGDRRVWYTISNGTIWSATYGFKARKYHGSNPHHKHTHVSVKEETWAWGDTSPWLDEAPSGGDGGRKIKPIPLSLSKVKEQFKIAAKLQGVNVPDVDVNDRRALNGVKRIQNALNRENDESLTVDGWVGPETLNAWGRHERGHGYGRPRVPDRHSLQPLAHGHFHIVK